MDRRLPSLAQYYRRILLEDAPKLCSISMTSRKEFFKDRVLKALYEDEEGSSEEENIIEKKSLANLSKLKKAQKRKDFGQLENTNQEDKDWPVPLPKLKKVYTSTVRPEDLQQTVVSKTHALDNTASKGSSSCSDGTVHPTGDAEFPRKVEQKVSKNKKRKLKKKKREKEKERKEKSSGRSTLSREFTY